MLLNGPNLNRLGTRHPALYGKKTLAQIEKQAEKRAAELGFVLECRQSNSESTLIDWVQEASARPEIKGLVLNAAAYSHTSIAIADAASEASEEGTPVVELHISNIYRREEMRRHSYISAAADGIIIGFGAEGYDLAVAAVAELATRRRRRA